MFQVNQRVQIITPHLLRILEQRNISPAGTVVAIVPDSRWPVKVLLDGGEATAIRFSHNGNVIHSSLSFTVDGRYCHGDLQPGLVVVNV